MIERRLLFRLPRRLFAFQLLMLISGPALAEPTRLVVDRERSYIGVRTGKGGLLSAFGVGHRHGISATEWSANICFDPQNIPASSVVITVSTASLRIDTSEARRRVGLDPKGPSPKDVQEIQEKMLASQNLAAEEHPDIQFRSIVVHPNNEEAFLMCGSLSIRGQPQTVSLPVALEPVDGQRYHFSGKFPIKQSSYGIKPESVAGVVNVNDELAVYFDFHATSTAKTCGR